MAGGSARQIAAFDDAGPASPLASVVARSAAVELVAVTELLMEEGNSPVKRCSQSWPLLSHATSFNIATEGTSSESDGGDDGSMTAAPSWEHHRTYMTAPMSSKMKVLMASGILLLLGASTRILMGVPGSDRPVAPRGVRERIEAVQVGSRHGGGVIRPADNSDSLVALPAKPEASPARGPVAESAKPLRSDSHLPPNSAVPPLAPASNTHETGMRSAPARAALGLEGLKQSLQNIQIPNFQNLLDGGEEASGEYKCQSIANMLDWSPDKQMYCCNTIGVGCAQSGGASATGDVHDDTDEVLTEPGNPHIYKPLIGEDGRFQSGVPLCDIGQDSCPKEWWTGPTGGFYCPDATDKQCRSLDEGPWDPQECKAQCSIGNTPITTTVTTTSTTMTRTYVGMSLKLLCWSLCSQPYELDIARFQMQRNAGIFDCDETAVLSFEPQTLDAGELGKLETIVIPRESVGRSKDGTAGNALQFMKAWDAIAHDGRWTRVDWVLKVDPDAVLLPDRIRIHLNPYQGQHVYVRNCDKPMSEGTMMFGALEAIASPGLQTYFNAGGRCYHEIPWQAWGEDLFMMRCLEHLGVGPVGDFGLIQDGVCKGVYCGSNWAAAFHPMKSVWAWENCWNQAIAAR
mmetsp:Transcript_24251/g.70179  ORF Transcript_24251/g.70179 Transcript_24251/m.70179 type:complete len:629 (+) Transcript_24251:143-2029(+)